MKKQFQSALWSIASMLLLLIGSLLSDKIPNWFGILAGLLIVAQVIYLIFEYRKSK